jgi:hypothetical protein
MRSLKVLRSSSKRVLPSAADAACVARLSGRRSIRAIRVGVQLPRGAPGVVGSRQAAQPRELDGQRGARRPPRGEEALRARELVAAKAGLQVDRELLGLGRDGDDLLRLVRADAGGALVADRRDQHGEHETDDRGQRDTAADHTRGQGRPHAALR